ncbi:MAG TPA: hypothetical protein VHK67_03535 [Rhabdochlamydiaceae bacterium]|jgi:hypothetical protein|nr:hypothetical protein [Rhabdochlamydiaceae bacterium]
MTATTPAAFTVTVNHKGVIYDVEVTPMLNGSPIHGIGDRLTQWNEVEKTNKIFSRTIQEIFVKSQIPDDRLTTGLLTVGLGRGISIDDRTEFNDDETKKVCDTFIRYLQDPDAGKAALDALDDADAIDGPGFTMRIAANAYLNLLPDAQSETRLSLFAKKCHEYFGLSYLPYTPLELSCHAFLSRQRKRSLETADKKEQLAREIKEWFFHERLLCAEKSAAASDGEMKQIKEERAELGAIVKYVADKAEAEKEAAETPSEKDDHLLSDNDALFDSDKADF